MTDGRPHPRVQATARRFGRSRWTSQLGGSAGNEILTNAAAAVLILLLAGEGVTIVHMQGLLSAHMFVGLVLIPPVALKLGSTGYRMIRYYSRSPSYRAAGPPRLPLRLIAPVLSLGVVVVLASGVLLLATGHKSNTLLMIHKTGFIVFGVLLVVHLVAYVPRVVRSLLSDWTVARRHALPGAGIRATLLAAAAGGGLALAGALLSSIDSYGR